MDNTPEIKFRGEVLSGRGEAKGFLEIDWVREQCSNAAGFDPYPGTLNLKVDPATSSQIRRLAMSKGKRIIPPPEAGDFCEARVLSLIVNGISGALVYPMVNDYYNDIIEFIAPVLLKEKGGIEDGSSLEAVLPPQQKLPRPSAVIFDLDGTLINSVDLYYSILCEGCLQLNEKPPAKDVFLESMGKGQGFWEGWAKITGNTPAEGNKREIKKQIMNIFEDIWQQRYDQEVSLFSGVKEMLLQLQARNVTMAVVTSSFYINKMNIFRQVGLEPDQLFASVITRNDTVQKKPHPEPINRCLKQLDIPPSRCIAVGDSPCDVVAAGEAGVFTVGVLTGAGTVQSLCKEGVDAVLDSAADLSELIM